jgi:prepilin-type processing-associated H-X9-DG protein
MRRGLTLIEALIVIGLLVVVAAILFPVFARSHEHSGPTCITKVKQIGLGMMQYCQDYDETLPPKRMEVNGHAISWRAELSPYIKSPGVFKCPDDPVASVPDVERDGLTRSYAVNGSSGGANGIGGPFADGRHRSTLTQLSVPASVILVSESTAAFADFNPLIPGEFAQPTDKNNVAGEMYMHRTVSIFLFADGHAKALPPLATVGGSSAQPINLWTVDNSPYSPVELKTAQNTLGYAAEHQ